MSKTDFDFIHQAAEKIKQQILAGEIVEACGMSAMPTPVTESWEVALVLAENNQLTSAQQRSLLLLLKPENQQQLKDAGFDDFDLIYEYLLQLVL